MPDPAAKTLFALASLLPAACLLVGVLAGGTFVWVALASITLLVLAMDKMAGGIEAAPAMARWLPTVICLAHFATLAAVLWSVGMKNHLGTSEKIVLIVAMGLYAGQVSNAAAHEMIHRRDRASRWLGTAVYCSILNGQHVSAHLLVHHVHAGTQADPVTARLGRGFYRFALAASIAEFRAGWEAETRRRATKAQGTHPYAVYFAGAGLSLLLAASIGGGISVLALIVISLHAQMQLLLSDYVQHYGLERKIAPDGRLEPMGPQHAWNAPHAYSGAMMVNAPRHSDHHMHPGRAFPHLEHRSASMPTLPHSLPVMATVALLPPLWRHMMDRRCRSWREGTARSHLSDASLPPAHMQQ
jgi:alkane 1-monooxygenase